MANVGIKVEQVFYHYLDDTAIKIIKLDDDVFVWIQYGPNEGSSCDVEIMKQYTGEEIISMIEFFQPYGNIEASEIFNKFINL